MGYTGRYEVKNPEKYVGNPTQCIYRSLWERTLMQKFDHSSAVIEWGSEVVVIPYISPIDGKRHRYFTDFYVKYRKKDGSIQTTIIEVKPSKETHQPTKRGRKNTKKFLTEVHTWGKNTAKWEAARSWCSARGWEFMIMTEYEIYGPTGRP